jgi:translation initiation factor 3 subunit L
MADPSAFYEPEEEELLSSLSVPNYDGAYDQDQEYQRHIQELESHAFNGQEQDQEQEQAAALESIPQDVKRVRRVEARREPRCVNKSQR